MQHQLNYHQIISTYLKTLLANTYVLYLKVQNCHWNIQGVNFFELHKFFEEEYKELSNAIDEIAERIRMLNETTPASLSEFMNLTSLSENVLLKTPFDMIKALIHDNETIIHEIKEILLILKDSTDYATLDLFIKRLSSHEKSLWMLKSMNASTI